jgi:3'-5' exonuclease
MLQVKPEKILFLDIETVPQYPSYDMLPGLISGLWEKKSSYFRKEDESASDVYPRAGIYAEFGKIICVSAGHFMIEKDGKRILRIKTFYGEDEKTLLSEFLDMLNAYTNKRDIFLCAHNGKEFDFPYLARRILIHGLKLPDVLNYAGQKPWDVPHLDTLQLWKFGDYKHYTSLELLAAIFDIPSPKEGIDGSMIYSIYWQDKDLKRIAEYCQRDVVTVAQLLLRFCGEEFIGTNDVRIIKD